MVPGPVPRVLFGMALVSCAGAPRVAPSGPDAPPEPIASAPAATPASASVPSATPASSAAAPQPAADKECPPGMLHVKHDFCPKLERVCAKSEYDKPNHITICHAFREGSNQCLEPRVPLDFCIDEYEYPNQKGAHPPVMVDWYQAMGMCAQAGKRLCYEAEWVAACEGPKEKPFPYGWERSAEKCNIDNRWIEPILSRVYSKDPEVQKGELARLDESVPSGAKPGCVSDFGVHDLTGNLDEWALADHDRPKEKAVFAALKGGAWGHVRNACRPVTTSHDPLFTYYFVSLRCCRDPASMEPYAGTGS
jgi:formylglycine-generating enzyme